MEAATAKLVQENYGLSAELEKSRAAIDEYKICLHFPDKLSTT